MTKKSKLFNEKQGAKCSTKDTKKETGVATNKFHDLAFHILKEMFKQTCQQIEEQLTRNISVSTAHQPQTKTIGSKN